MSQIAPDLPELQSVPYALRSIVYVRALNRAVRSPLTWLMGALAIAVGVGIGANQGSALVGRPGAFLGAVMGASAAIWSFFKVLLPWRARRMLPSVIEQSADPTPDAVGDADDRLKRMVDAHKRRGSS